MRYICASSRARCRREGSKSKSLKSVGLKNKKQQKNNVSSKSSWIFKCSKKCQPFIIVYSPTKRKNRRGGDREYGLRSPSQSVILLLFSSLFRSLYPTLTLVHKPTTLSLRSVFQIRSRSFKHLRTGPLTLGDPHGC